MLTRELALMEATAAGQLESARAQLQEERRLRQDAYDEAARWQKLATQRELEGVRSLGGKAPASARSPHHHPTHMPCLLLLQLHASSGAPEEARIRDGS